MTIQLFELAGANSKLRFSPYAWRTCMALAHKGLTWETIPWRFSDKAAIAKHGSQTVPVLLDGDRAIVDSWNIMQYLDENYAQRPLLFDSPAARSEALFIKLWTERVLHSLITRMIISDILLVLADQDKAYFRESREKRLGAPLESITASRDQTRDTFRTALEPLRAMLAVQPFIGGAAANYADYVVFGAFMWARNSSTYELLATDDPVYQWRARLLSAFDGLAQNSLAAGR